MANSEIGAFTNSVELGAMYEAIHLIGPTSYLNT
jgi:hypothetical protein